MSNTITNVFALGSEYAGATLRAQLYDSSNSASGGEISSGFYERDGSAGIFAFTLTTADDFSGYCDVYEDGVSGEVLGCIAINPQEVENADVRTSTRLADADYTAPPSASDIDTQLSGVHGVGSWATATGFATPTNVSDAQSAVQADIATLPDTSAIITAIMAEAVTGGKTVEDVLRNLWSRIVGDSDGDDGNDPTSITYKDADGNVDVTHTLTDTTRRLA